MPEFLATVEDGKASVKEQSVLVPFVYGKGEGYKFIARDLGFSVVNPDEAVTHHKGIKIELCRGTDEDAGAILPPEAVQNFRKWLNNLLFLKSPQKKGAMPMKRR